MALHSRHEVFFGHFSPRVKLILLLLALLIAANVAHHQDVPSIWERIKGVPQQPSPLEPEEVRIGDAPNVKGP